MKLNLGSGNNPKEGFINIDRVKTDKVDLVFDLNDFPYPFKDNSVDEIYCRHFLEHLNDFDTALREFHRILKKEGTLEIIVPDFSSANAFVPEHKVFFNYNSFNPFSVNIDDINAKEKLFFMVERRIVFPHEFFKGLAKLFMRLLYVFPIMVYNYRPSGYMIYLSHLFPASELYFKLKKV